MTTPPLKLAFAGTPELAAQILRRLLAAGETVTAVYTRPDKPAGRGRKTRPGAVAQAATEHGLQLRRPRDAAALAADETLAAVDALVVVAYGLILPPEVLARPRAGCLNIHASLLPRWRGAAPIQRAIQHGDMETGVTIIQMDAGIDTGPILLQKPCPIASTDTAAVLHARLARLGGDCILETLEALRQNRLRPQPQPEAGASYAARIDKAEARIDWGASAGALRDMVRAFNPAPVAFACVQNHAVRVWEAVALDSADAAARRLAGGEVAAYTPQGLDIACGDGVLRVTRLQLQGRRPQAIADFYHGHPTLFAR